MIEIVRKGGNLIRRRVVPGTKGAYLAPILGQNKIEIRTQYEGSTTKFLKEVRVITSQFTLEEG